MKQVNHLVVVVAGEPEFKVLSHRATELGVGVLFGAVGAIANSAYTNSMDSQLEDRLEPQIRQISYRESFETQLKQFLEESKRFQKIDFYEKAAREQSFDAILELSIKEWGIKLIDQRTEDLVPFMTIEIKLTDSNGKIIWKEREVEVGRSGHTIEKYNSQENLLKDTLRTVLKDTAYRITSTLVYS